MVNSNMVNSKFHLIQSFYEVTVNSFPIISCLKYTVNPNFHLIRSKTLLTNDFELTVPDLYVEYCTQCLCLSIIAHLCINLVYINCELCLTIHVPYVFYTQNRNLTGDSNFIHERHPGIHIDGYDICGQVILNCRRFLMKF